MTEIDRDSGYFPLDDDNVVELGRFLRQARLSNNTIAGIPAGMSELLAQAVLNWFANAIYEDGQWITRADLAADPDFGDVEVTEYGDGEVIKLRHRTTGVVALGTTKPQAWTQLRQRVREHRRKDGQP